LQLITPAPWPDYQLIDSGNYQKLERFGEQVLWRPEPQAIWQPYLPEREWEKQAHAHFDKQGKGGERGQWKLKSNAKDTWWMQVPVEGSNLKFRLALTAFKHVGIFPEQAANWHYIYEQVKKQQSGAKVLNLFAYTGGASVAAAVAGAKVVHVDSVKQVVQWGRDNAEKAGIDGVSWVTEDAALFVKREVKRAKLYNGIVLDPPAYGRGPKGEKWVLEEALPSLLEACAELLAPGGFVLLNLYSMGLSAVVAANLVKQYFSAEPEFGELYLPDKQDNRLPLGVFARGTKVV
jgi:23S rRNA (cytosine1962-C5)-methyltransferase